MNERKIKDRARVYKFRVEQKLKNKRIPTITELTTLKRAGIDTSKYAKFAIEKYKPFLKEENNA